LGIGAFEPRAAPGERIDVGRLDEGVAVAAEVGVEIVGDDEEDVRATRGLRRTECGAGHGTEKFSTAHGKKLLSPR